MGETPSTHRGNEQTPGDPSLSRCSFSKSALGLSRTAVLARYNRYFMHGRFRRPGLVRLHFTRAGGRLEEATARHSPSGALPIGSTASRISANPLSVHAVMARQEYSSMRPLLMFAVLTTALIAAGCSHSQKRCDGPSGGCGSGHSWFNHSWFKRNQTPPPGTIVSQPLNPGPVYGPTPDATAPPVPPNGAVR
jgi:hypothetical protein